MYLIEYARSVSEELHHLRAYDSRMIVSKIEEQLQHDPGRRTRNKKPLTGLIPPWGSTGLVWELRVGQYRVFYEIDETERRVVVQALRHKPPHVRTEDLL